MVGRTLCVPWARGVARSGLVVALLNVGVVGHTWAVGPESVEGWTELPAQSCPPFCAGADRAVGRGRTWARIRGASNRIEFVRLGDVDRRFTWEAPGGGATLWPVTVEERVRSEPRVRLRLQEAGEDLATYLVEPAATGLVRSALAPDHVEHSLVMDRDLDVRSLDLRPLLDGESWLRVILDDAEVPTVLLHIGADGALRCRARIRSVVEGPADWLLLQRCDEQAHPLRALLAGLGLADARLVVRNGGQPIAVAERWDGYRSRLPGDVPESWWAGSALGRLAGAGRSLEMQAVGVARAPLPPLPPGVQSAPLSSVLRDGFARLRAAWPVGLAALAWVSMMFVLCFAPRTQAPATAPPAPWKADSGAIRARVRARVRGLVRGLFASLGVPLDGLALGIEARLVHRITAEIAADPELLGRLDRAKHAADLDLASGEESGARSCLAVLLLREVVGLPAWPHGLLGELAGRGPLAHSLASRGAARVAAGEGRAWLAEARQEAGFWRAVLRDQYRRLEAARRDLGPPPRTTRADLFLAEDLDDLYRTDPDAWARLRASEPGLDAIARDPAAIASLIPRLLRPAVPAAFPSGVRGLLQTLGRVASGGFWRGVEPGPPPVGSPGRLARSVYWGTGIGTGLLFAGWLGVRTLSAVGSARAELGLWTPLAALPLVFAAPLALHSTLALWAAGAAYVSGAARGWGRSRGDWLDRKTTRWLLGELLPARDPFTGRPSSETWAALVGHLAETHLLTAAEAAALRAPAQTSTRLPRPRDPEARERLRRWVLRHHHPRPPLPGWERLPSCTWLISAYGEKYAFTWEELVEPGAQDGADIRLRYLSQRYPLAWANLLDDLRGRAALVSSPEAVALLAVLAALPRHRPAQDALSRNAGTAGIVAAAESWANLRLPTNLRLVASLEPLREALRGYARLCLGESEASESEIRALVAEKLQVILRDDSVRAESHAEAPNAVRAREDLERRGWLFVWMHEREIVHSSKYGGWGRVLHRVRGDVIYGSDSHMELPFEDAPWVLGALGAFEADPRLGLLVTAVESYSEGFSTVGRLVGGAETVWGAVEQRRKSWTDRPINAGKCFLRRELVCNGEALQDDYVSEDAATGFRFLTQGVGLGFTDSVRLGWRSPVNLPAAGVPLGKYAAGSAEFLLGRAFSRLLDSPHVHWTTKVGTLYNSLFYGVAALAAGLVPTALMTGYVLGLAPRTPLPAPALLGLVFVLLSQVLGLQTVVLLRERRGGWIRACAGAMRRVLDGFAFFNLLIPFYAQMFWRGLRGNAVFHVTQKTPDVAARTAAEVNQLLRVPVLLGLALVPALLLAPFAPERAGWWALLLGASLCWVFGPHLFYALEARGRLETGDLVAALRGVCALLDTPSRVARGRLARLAHQLARGVGWLALAPAALPVVVFELPRQPLAQLAALRRHAGHALVASPRLVVASGLLALGVAGASVVQRDAEARPLEAVAAADPAIRWMVEHTAPTGLVYSNVGDPSTDGWAYLYDEMIGFHALLAAGETARALDLLSAVWEQFPEVDGWRINAVDARFGGGVEWVRHTGPNAHLGRACLIAWQLTGDRRWLRRATDIADALLGVQDRTPGAPAEGGIAMGPPARQDGDQRVRDGVEWRDIYGLESNLAAHSLLLALSRARDEPRWAEAADALVGFVARRYDPSIGAFLPGLSPGGTGEQTLATDVQGIAVSSLGMQAVDAIAPDASMRLLDWLADEAAVLAPDASLLGYDFQAGRRQVVTVEWSAQIAAAELVLARDLAEAGRPFEAARMRARGESLLRTLHRLAWYSTSKLGYAYLADGRVARFWPAWSDDAPLVPGGQNLITAAYLSAVSRGWDPLGPLGKRPGPAFPALAAQGP